MSTRKKGFISSERDGRDVCYSRVSETNETTELVGDTAIEESPPHPLYQVEEEATVLTSSFGEEAADGNIVFGALRDGLPVAVVEEGKAQIEATIVELEAKSGLTEAEVKDLRKAHEKLAYFSEGLSQWLELRALITAVDNLFDEIDSSREGGQTRYARRTEPEPEPEPEQEEEQEQETQQQEEELPIKEPGEPEAEEEEREIPETAKIRTSDAAANKILDRIRQRREAQAQADTDDDGWETLGSPFGQENEVFEALQDGELSVSNVEKAIADLKEDIAELEAKDVRTETEAETLRELQQTVALFQEGLEQFQEYEAGLDVDAEEEAAGSVNNTLYFNYESLRGPFRALSTFFADYPKIGGQRYTSVEHYMLSMKFANSGLKMWWVRARDGKRQQIPVSEGIRRANTAEEAWKIANKYESELTPEQTAAWVQRRSSLMREALLAKYASPQLYKFDAREARTLADWLLATGDRRLLFVEPISTDRETISNAKPVWGVNITPQGVKGENLLGRHLMQIRQQLKDGKIPVPTPADAEPAGQMPFADLPPRMQSAADALGIDIRSLYLHNTAEMILNKAAQGNLTFGIAGSQRNNSSFSSMGETEEQTRQKKIDVATRLGWITDASEWDQAVEERIDAYNKAQGEGANAAAALATALNEEIAVTDGTFGTGREVVKAVTKQKRANVLVAMPGGIERRATPFSRTAQYQPNVPEIDGVNAGAISMHPTGYDANEVTTATGRSPYQRNNFQKNALIASLSHVTFITHASHKENDQAVDTALKSLQAGRPVVILDPALFGSPLEGSEYLATLPGVIVLKNTKSSPLVKKGEYQNKRTGKIETTYLWDGKNLLKALKEVATLTHPTSAFAEKAYQEFETKTADWTEGQLQDRIGEIQSQLTKEGAIPTQSAALRASAELRILNRLLAARHPAPTTSSEFEYVTPLDEAERTVTGGLIGLRNYENFETFYRDLKASGVKVFVDVRMTMWDRQRNPQTNALEDSWSHAERLRESFRDTDIKYVAAHEFTPSQNDHAYQLIIDRLSGITRTNDRLRRGGLDPAFTAAYHNYLRKTQKDLGMFLKDTIRLHIAGEALGESAIAFGALERESRASHRSILGEIMHDVLGMRVVDIQPGGLTEVFDPVGIAREVPAPPPDPIAGRSEVRVTKAMSMYAPKAAGALALVDLKADTEGTVQQVIYRHAHYPGFELILRRGPEDSVEWKLTTPRTQEADLLQLETEMTEGAAELGMRTAFPSELGTREAYAGLVFGSEDFPVAVEHLFRSLAPGVVNPGIYGDSSVDSVESHPNDPLIPVKRRGNLKYRVVNLASRDTEQGGLAPPQDIVTRGEYAKVGEQHHTRDEDQTFSWQEENVPYASIPVLTEKQVYHYYLGNFRDIEVRLSVSGKYLSVVTPQNKGLRLPLSFPLNIRLQMPWSDFSQGWDSENEALYEYLWVTPHLWRTDVRGDTERVSFGTPVELEDLSVADLVFKGYTIKEKQQQWDLVKSFITRYQTSRTDARPTEAEIAAVRQFVLRLPDPPNILTQVENYLKSIRREMQRLTPHITSVPVPQTVEYSPETIQTVLLSEITNQGVGSMDDIDLDNPDFAQDQAEAEEPDTATDEEIIEAGERPPDADEDTEDDGEGVVEDPRSPKAQIRSLAGRVAATGVPRESQIDEIYAPQWFDTYEMVINAPENGFDALWNDGSIPATAEVKKKGPDGKWRATGERRGAGLSDMAGDTAHMLKRLAGNTEDTVKQNRLMQLAADLETFTSKNENFSMMSLWEPEGVALKQLLNTLQSAFVELRGLDAFKLKGVVLTNLPLSAFQKNLETLAGERPRSDIVLTNTGKLVPASAMHEYVVIPDKKQVFRRPSTQLRMAVASMEETDADGTKRESTRFYIDRTKGTQFEVIQDSDTEVQVAMLGSDLTIRFKKGEKGEVTIENRKDGTISDKVFVTNWQTGPLNTTDALRRAIAPIAMVMRDGFSLSGNIPLQLAAIDMGGQGAWRFELGDTVAFDLGADGVVESPDYTFTVQVVPTESGFRYRIDAFRGDESVPVFRDANGTPVPAVAVAIETPDGQPRSPHEAISYILWSQREVAAEKGWNLPKVRPFGQRVEVQEGKPPTITGWREADTDPNNILIEDWKDWSRDIAFVFGAELTQAIETAVFASETPLYTRLDVYEALVDVVNREVMDSLDAQRTVAQLRWAVPSLLRRRLEAQNTWTPTDKNWVEQHYDNPVVRRYVHQEYQGYVVEFLEGSGVAKVFYNGVVLEEIDYADARSLWEYVGRKFVNTVRGHMRRMIEAGSFGNYNIRREVNDDVVWEISDERRVRFPAIERAAVLEVYRNGNWEPERRRETRVVITDIALERQLAFVKEFEERDAAETDTDDDLEPLEVRAALDRRPTRTYARYTGPVRRLPRDIEDTQYYAGKDTPPVDHIQRYAIEGEPIEMHLLLTDRADDPSQANFPSPARSPVNAEKFRRVAFFDTERGIYVRREADAWVPDPTTFEAEPLRGFEHRRQTSELPVDIQSETPGESSREATEIDNERKAAIQAQRAYLRRTTPWILVDGVSESYILSTLEQLYRDMEPIRFLAGAYYSPVPEGIQHHFRVDIEISRSNFIETAESESAIAQELEARHTRFLQGVKAFNEQMVQSGQSTLAQSSTGLTPDGVALRVPNRNDAMQSTGFVNGVRVYESGTGLRIAIAQSAPDTFIASVTHAASGASLTIRDINASGFKKRSTARSYMDPLVLAFYEDEGYMGESGEAEILANAFDSAALSAIETFHRFADHSNKDRFFEKNVTVEYFVENAFDVEPPLSDRRMEGYRNELKDELDAETRATVLENLQELVDQQRALQNGLETSVSNYRRLLKSLEVEIARSGSEEVQKVYNRWGIRRLVFPKVGEGSPVGREALLNAIDTHVSNDVLRKSLREVVDSLESQMRRITRSYPIAIRDVKDAIWRLQGEYFKDAPYRPAVIRGQRRKSQNVLNTVLKTREGGREHVADSLTLDPETFDTASLTHSVTISDTALAQELRARREEIAGASPIAEQTQAEGVTVDVDGTEHRAVRASYRVTNNPFIRINAVSQAIEGSPATETQEAVGPREEILLVVEPRMRISRQNRVIFSLEVENSTDGEGTRIERLPRIVESFAQANYATLSAWLNPVHRGHIRVKELSSGETIYQITDDLRVSVRQVGNGQWQVEMPLLEQRDTDAAEQIEAMTEELDPADYDMIENIDLFRAEPGTVPQGIDYNTNFVLASSAYDALQKVILQKLANRENAPAFYRAIEPALQDVMFDDIRGRIATRFAEQVAGVETAVGAAGEPQVVEVVESYFSELKQEGFSTVKEYQIQMGVAHRRADVVLIDSEGNFAAIAECTCISR